MAVQYEIDGNVFREITTSWLCAYVKEFLIKARQIDTNQAGDTVEHVQLNDGRVFTRLVGNTQSVNVSKASNTLLWNTRTIDRSITQPR
jgi:hypothetical protein